VSDILTACLRALAINVGAMQWWTNVQEYDPILLLFTNLRILLFYCINSSAEGVVTLTLALTLTLPLTLTLTLLLTLPAYIHMSASLKL